MQILLEHDDVIIHPLDLTLVLFFFFFCGEEQYKRSVWLNVDQGSEIPDFQLAV